MLVQGDVEIGGRNQRVVGDGFFAESVVHSTDKAAVVEIFELGEVFCEGVICFFDELEFWNKGAERRYRS